MDKLSYSEVMAILGGAEFPLITISRDGVFISPVCFDESFPTERNLIRELEANHPLKDITKPLFTFPCSVEQLRDFLIDNDAIGLLSGVLYLDKSKKYIANEIIDLMFQANLAENLLSPHDHEMMQFSIQNKKTTLENHEAQKGYYKQRMIKFLKRYSITLSKDDTDAELKNISLENVMNDVINWLQGERFAVFFNSQSNSQNLTQENERLKQLPVADTPKATRTRKDPVREAMESIITTNPTVNKAEMWAELQKLARSSRPPFVDEQDEHTLIYVAGGAAKKDIKKLTKEQADTRLISYKTK